MKPESLMRRYKMKIRKYFDKLIENWPAKVLSFAFALVLVQFYKNSLLEKKYFSVPLIIENSGNLVPAATIPRTVKISVWGETEGIAAIREDDIVAYLDLSAISSEGEHNVPIQTKRRGLALNVSPLEINVEPIEIKVNLEKSLSKRVNVKLSFKGKPAQNYEIYETGIEPPAIEITGPTSIISNIEDIFTNSISVENRQTSFSNVIEVVNSNPLVSIVGSSKINYSVKIREVLELKTFNNVALYFDNLADEFEIASDIPSGSLTVKGAKSVVSSWKVSATTLRVLCGNIVTPGIYSLPVQAVVPGKLALVEANPKNIQIEVRKRSTEDENQDD